MIRATDLRIGNFIQQGEIEMISETAIWIGDKPFLIDEIEPIPLTEEWLFRFGAIEEIKGIFVIDRFKLIWKNEYNYWYIIDRYNDCYYSKVEFVHEWQNLYFALNGIEL